MKECRRANKIYS